MQQSLHKTSLWSHEWSASAGLRDSRHLLFWLIGIAFIARVGFVFLVNAYNDDAYITFRYARNVITGSGFAYNAGEAVFGASSPLYVLIWAVVGSVVSFASVPFLAQWFGCLSLFGFVALLWDEIPFSTPVKLVVSIGLLSYPRIFYSSIGGMEECFILLIMGLSYSTYRRQSAIGLGISLAILFLCKIDTLIWIVCLLAVIVLAEKRAPWKSLLVALLFSLPWIIYAVLKFGSVIPHTVEAKQIAYSHEPGLPFVDAVLFTVPDAYRNNPYVVLLFGVAVYGILVFTLVRAVKSKSFSFLVFPVYCLVYTLVLLLSGTSLGLWERWTVPHWGMFLVSSGYFVEWMVSRFHVDETIIGKPWYAPAVLSLLLVCLTASFLYPYRASPDPESSREVGVWLRNNAQSQESVMLEPIGFIGYLSNLRVHDFIGLITPEVTSARQQTPGSNRWFTRYLKQHEPSFVVFRSSEVKNNQFMSGGCGDGIFLAEEADWFNAHYILTYQTKRGEVTEELRIYKRAVME